MPLSREHIIPFSLGGNLVLPLASCADHAKTTSEFERVVARDIYGVHRAHEGTASRRKGRHAATLTRKVEVSGIDANGAPVSKFLESGGLPKRPIAIQFKPPGLLTGDDPDVEASYTMDLDDGAHGAKLLAEIDALRLELGWQELSVPSTVMNPRSFMRMLAKAAHAYASAELGVGAFSPSLLPLILENSGSGTYFVGGFDPQEAQESSPLKLRQHSLNGQNWIVVEISLRFFRELPKYQVVAGTV